MHRVRNGLDDAVDLASLVLDIFGYPMEISGEAREAALVLAKRILGLEANE